MTVVHELSRVSWLCRRILALLLPSRRPYLILSLSLFFPLTAGGPRTLSPNRPRRPCLLPSSYPCRFLPLSEAPPRRPRAQCSRAPVCTSSPFSSRCALSCSPGPTPEAPRKPCRGTAAAAAATAFSPMPRYPREPRRAQRSRAAAKRLPASRARDCIFLIAVTYYRPAARRRRNKDGRKTREPRENYARTKRR
ncbi:hypothetical protein PUN28_004099 [Cardiocondyla obscurior]|uniref:Uncharacterized protein n=1 Tax=Cardiocondyla obscurior TaxID=286306 RepID=A0AAW2GPI9_9HYME